MRPVNRLRTGPDFFGSVLLLVSTLSLFAACSGANPIQLPAKMSEKRIGALETNSGDASQKAEGVDGPRVDGPSDLKQSLDQAESLEVIGQALLALQSLDEADVGRISSADLGDATVQTECRFAALEKNSDAITADSRFNPSGSLFGFSPSQSDISLASCRCLVEKHSRELGIALQPVSGL